MSASPDVLVGSFAAENRSVFRARLTLHRPHVGNGEKAPVRMLLPNASPEALQESHLGWHRTHSITGIDFLLEYTPLETGKISLEYV